MRPVRVVLEIISGKKISNNNNPMKTYNAAELIREKRDGGRLSDAAIDFLVSAYTRGEIPDYQFAAFLMAVYFRGMDFKETAHLTRAMLNSGKRLDLAAIKKFKIDKHSTGGVGDKVSLVLAPLVACCGICVPMISGRGLGHTGGTLDKLESIPGFRTDLTVRQMTGQLKKIGVAMVGQTGEIAPADKKIYALRDVTATVESIPLICASIISKKLAAGLDGLVLDVKFGSGAFVKDYRSAKILGRALVRTGRTAGLKTIAILTDMNNPLGHYIGNGIEVMEAIEALKGRGPADLMAVTMALGEAMLEIAGVKDGGKLLAAKIAAGEALAKFRDIIRLQGGDPRVLDDYSRLPAARKAMMVAAGRRGWVQAIDNFAVGSALIALGGGRLKKEDRIDHGCGFRIYKKIGDRVKKGDVLIEIYSDDKEKTNIVWKSLKNSYIIKRQSCKHRTLVRETIK